jgi:hypothetical protein
MAFPSDISSRCRWCLRLDTTYCPAFSRQPDEHGDLIPAERCGEFLVRELDTEDIGPLIADVLADELGSDLVRLAVAFDTNSDKGFMVGVQTDDSTLLDDLDAAVLSDEAMSKLKMAWNHSAIVHGATRDRQLPNVTFMIQRSAPLVPLLPSSPFQLAETGDSWSKGRAITMEVFETLRPDTLVWLTFCRVDSGRQEGEGLYRIVRRDRNFRFLADVIGNTLILSVGHNPMAIFLGQLPGLEVRAFDVVEELVDPDRF